MNRVAAIQKSSRTSTRHWTRPPSHWRKASTRSLAGAFLPRVQPLLELVEHNEELLAGWQGLSAAQARQSGRQSVDLRKGGKVFDQRRHQTRLGLIGGGLDVDRQHVGGQPRCEPGLDERRFAAARGPVDEPDGERLVGNGLVDASFPEANTLRQPITDRAGRARGSERNRRLQSRTTASRAGRQARARLAMATRTT